MLGGRKNRGLILGLHLQLSKAFLPLIQEADALLRMEFPNHMMVCIYKQVDILDILQTYKSYIYIYTM